MAIKTNGASVGQLWNKLSNAFVDDPLRILLTSGLAAVVIVTTSLLLFNHPYPLARQPFPDAHEYLNTAYRLAHGHGYTTTVRDNPRSGITQVVNPPRFPPGTSLVLAPFALLGHYPGNVEFGSRVLVVGLVLATGWAAYTLAGWYAALVASLVASTSEFVLVNSHLVMSDALGALLAVLCLPLLRINKIWAMYLVGFIAGYGFVVREAGLVIVVCALIVVSRWDRLRVIAGAFLPVVGLLLYNWSTFGRPWKTGYDYWLGHFHEYALRYAFKHPWKPGGEIGLFASPLHIFNLVAYGPKGAYAILPSAIFYPLILLGFSAVFGPPLFSLLGLIAAVKRWRWPEARFTLLLTVLTALVYMPNFTQDPRFMAGPCFVLIAWASAALVHIAPRAFSTLLGIAPPGDRPQAAAASEEADRQ